MYTTLRPLRRVMEQELWQPSFALHGYPAAVWSKVTYMAHQPNESCVIANMLGMQKSLPTYSSKGELPRDKSVASNHFE